MVRAVRAAPVPSPISQASTLAVPNGMMASAGEAGMLGEAVGRLVDGAVAAGDRHHIVAAAFLTHDPAGVARSGGFTQGDPAAEGFEPGENVGQPLAGRGRRPD